MTFYIRACRCTQKEVHDRPKQNQCNTQPLPDEFQTDGNKLPLTTNGSGGARIYNYTEGLPFVMKVRMLMECQEGMTTVFEWSVRPPAANICKPLMYRPEMCICGMERIVESLYDKLLILGDTMDTGTCNRTKAHVLLPVYTNLNITNPTVTPHTPDSVSLRNQRREQAVLLSVEITKLDPDNMATWASASGQIYPLIPLPNKNETPQYAKHKVHHPVLHYGSCIPVSTTVGNLMSYETYTRNDSVIHYDTSKPIIYTQLYRNKHVILRNRLVIYTDGVTSEPYYICEYTVDNTMRTYCYQVIVCANGMQRLFEYVYQDLIQIDETSNKASVYMIMSNGYDISSRMSMRLTHFQIDEIHPTDMFIPVGVQCPFNPCVSYFVGKEQ
jgi:hypothetical protein